MIYRRKCNIERQGFHFVVFVFGQLVLAGRRFNLNNYYGVCCLVSMIGIETVLRYYKVELNGEVDY